MLDNLHMPIEFIDINDILIDNSRFSLSDYLFEPGSMPTGYTHSFERMGILHSIIVYRDINGHFHLIDGKKRVQFVRQKSGQEIRAAVLPDSTSFMDIVELIFYNRKSAIEASVINKIQYICFTMSLGISASWILQSLCPLFEFKPHSTFLQECEKIYNLPVELRLFCHEKRFSLKQLINITQNPPDLLAQLVTWKSVLHLTASTLNELASNLRNYLKRDKKKLDDFLLEPDVQEIFDSSCSTREKTDLFRQYLRSRQYPILTEMNSKFEQKIKNLNLPKEISIDWDRTLENKNLELSINIKDPKRWAALLQHLNSRELRAALDEILNEL